MLKPWSQAYHDLEWLIRSPFLLDACHPHFRDYVLDAEWAHEMQIRSEPLLRSLGEDPTPLEYWLTRQAIHRLGHYFEHLMGFWLHHLPDIQDLQQRLPIREAGRTLGELDVLYRDQRRQTVFHLELAVKYYLQIAGGRAVPEDFVGPHAIDRLSLKIHRLLHHQLPLAHVPAAWDARLPAWRQHTLVSRAFVKGGLFFPLADWMRDAHTKRLALPPGCQTPQGWWMRASDCIPAALDRLEGDRWLVLPRLRWLSHFQGPLPGDILMSASQFCSEPSVSALSRAVLVVGCRPQESRWTEVTRGFIVPDHWPHQDAQA